MKAISIRCPECGAKLSVSVDARESLCEYCGAKSLIQRRTGFFERVEPPANRGHGAQHLPVAIQRHSTGWTVALIAIPMLLVGLAFPLLASQRAEQRARAAAAQPMTSTSTPSVAAIQPPESPKLTWLSGGAALVDINGDGRLDAVGRILLSTANSRDTKLAAFDGVSGAPLWMSQELKLNSEVTPGPLVVSEDTLVFPENKTTLRGFSLADGAARWTSTLPEKLNQLCQGNQPESIALQTADKLWHSLLLADGSLADLIWEGPCRSLEGDSAYLSRANQLLIDTSFEHSRMALGSAEGMSARAGVFDMGSKIAIALAIKQPGSAVPMLARYEHQHLDARILEGDLEAMRIVTPPQARKELDRKWYAAGKKVPKTNAKVLWAVAVPSGDPLKAREGALTHRNVALQDELVVAAYESAEGSQVLTAFNVADGTRLWEVALAGATAPSRILASPDHVIVIRLQRLSAFGLRDGQAAYSIP